MNKFLKIYLTIILFFIFTSNSFSQLSGTYTVGSGEVFPTIKSATVAVYAQGVNGPVTFNIKTGIYNDTLRMVGNVSGSSGVNTITFQSQTGNLNDVSMIGFRIWGASNILLKNVTLLPGTTEFAFNNNVQIVGVDFGGMGCGGLFIPIGNNIKFIGNKSIQGISYDEYWGQSRNLQFINNEIRYLWLYNADSVLLENNIMLGNLNPFSNIINFVNCSYIYIFKNKIVSTGNNAFRFISCTGELLIYNNFVAGQALGSALPIESSFSTIKIIYNTFYCSAFVEIDGSLHECYFLNNLILNPSGQMASYLSSTLPGYSDYNNFYNNGNSPLINFNGTPYNNVADYSNATGLDQHSNSHPVTFTSPTDLHLAGSSIGDQQLAGIPTALVTDDIDGNPRNPLHPYKGADEVDVPLPVELSSFTSSVNSNTVTLNWTTSFEENNSGFEIERSDYNYQLSMFNDQWSKIAYIKGNGTSTSQNNYNYTNKNLSSGKYKYRLKQIDFNGNFEYYNLSNEVMIGIPDKMYLSQNYPNPFNPVTVIRFNITPLYPPFEKEGNGGFVQLKVYNSVGKEVATLVDEKKDAGYYEVLFDGNNLASGIYFYSLNVDGKNIDTKRMVLLK